MLILHVTVSDDATYLWSENGAVGDFPLLDKAKEKINLYLPDSGSSLLPSTKLTRQSVNALAMSYEDICELYILARNGNTPGCGVHYSDSVLWLVELLSFSLHIIALQCFYPYLKKEKGIWNARWVAVLSESANEQFQKLVYSMPNVVRSYAYSASDLPNKSKELIAKELLLYIVDLFVRNVNEELEPLDDYDSIHDAWLDALDSENPIVKWTDEEELSRFAKQLQSWVKPIDSQYNSAFRLCFRLSEPKDKTDLWRVDYLLQMKDDQSVFLKLADLWNPDSDQARHLLKYGGIPNEFIFTVLGQAAELCPFVKKSLKTKNPSGCDFSTQEAVLFLKNYTSVLQAAGFNLILPAWWTVSENSNKITLNLNAKSPTMSGHGNLTLSTLLDYDYSISLGEAKVSAAELNDLAKLKVPLVQVQGQWTMIDQKQISAALKFINNKKKQSISASQLVKTALGSNFEIDGLAIQSVSVDGWVNDVLGKLKGENKLAFLDQPENFVGELRKYQLHGYSWLAFLRQYGFGACLADDMGLGKTVQTLTLILKEYNAGEQRPVLLICPTSVVNNWRREADKFTPELPVLIHHGNDRFKDGSFAKRANEHAIVVSSFGLLQRDIDFLNEVQWAGVILDEAQNIKNPQSKQSQAARSIVADYRIALTGTPVENHVGDLWALMEFLNPGLLGSQSSFKSNFFKQIQLTGDDKAAATLKALTGPFILRRMKTDKSIIHDLPEKIEVKEYCTLTKEQVSLYQAIVNDMQDKVENSAGINRQGAVLSLLLKLKQVCNHPTQFLADNSRLDNRSGKLQRLIEMLSEIRELGESVLVFSQFAQMGTLLQTYLQDYFGEEIFFLHGSVAKKKRDEMIERFQNEENGPKIFILSLKAGGTGLTLTKANHVIHYDRWWNPAVENQATDRVFRIGQKKNVQVYKFIVAGTLEEKIDDMIEKKIGVANMVVSTGEKWLGDLSNVELRDLIKLSENVTGE